MDRKRSIIRAGAVLAVALAAGHLVQTMTAPQEVAAAPQAVPTAVEPTSAGDEAAALPKAEAGLPAGASLAAAPAVEDLAAKEPAAKEPAAEEPAVTAAAAEPAPAAETDLAALTEDPVAPIALPVLPPVSPAPPLAEAPAAAAEPAADPVPETAAADPEVEVPPVAAPGAAPAAAPDCTPKLTLQSAPQAMISLTLAAPCHADQRVILRHAGLAVAEKLDATGSLSLDLPALSTLGEVSVLFADATIARDAVPVPDAARVQRFAVQWMADDSFQLHALEGGASYGEPGHVSADQPVSPNGGFLLSLGNPTLDLPMMAQVYTWPADAAVAVEASVEAVVTDTTCARELLGETIHAAGGKTVVKDLTLAMPDCDALGDILVLNNLVPDVTLAAVN